MILVYYTLIKLYQIGRKKKEKQSLTNIYGHTHNLEYEKASTALKLVCIPMGM